MKLSRVTEHLKHVLQAQSPPLSRRNSTNSIITPLAVDFRGSGEGTGAEFQGVGYAVGAARRGGLRREEVRSVSVNRRVRFAEQLCHFEPLTQLKKSPLIRISSQPDMDMTVSMHLNAKKTSSTTEMYRSEHRGGPTAAFATFSNAVNSATGDVSASILGTLSLDRGGASMRQQPAVTVTAATVPVAAEAVDNAGDGPVTVPKLAIGRLRESPSAVPTPLSMPVSINISPRAILEPISKNNSSSGTGTNTLSSRSSSSTSTSDDSGRGYFASMTVVKAGGYPYTGAGVAVTLSQTNMMMNGVAGVGRTNASSRDRIGSSSSNNPSSTSQQSLPLRDAAMSVVPSVSNPSSTTAGASASSLAFDGTSQKSDDSSSSNNNNNMATIIAGASSHPQPQLRRGIATSMKIHTQSNYRAALAAVASSGSTIGASATGSKDHNKDTRSAAVTASSAHPGASFLAANVTTSEFPRSLSTGSVALDFDSDWLTSASASSSDTTTQVGPSKGYPGYLPDGGSQLHRTFSESLLLPSVTTDTVTAPASGVLFPGGSGGGSGSCDDVQSGSGQQPSYLLMRPATSQSYLRPNMNDRSSPKSTSASGAVRSSNAANIGVDLVNGSNGIINTSYQNDTNTAASQGHAKSAWGVSTGIGNTPITNSDAISSAAADQNQYRVSLPQVSPRGTSAAQQMLQGNRKEDRPVPGVMSVSGKLLSTASRTYQ